MSQARQLAHYQLQSRLGQGAMGIVFRARDERLERDVAIKLLQVSLDTAEAVDYSSRLLQEARSAARLNHPGIITVYDCGEWQGKPYLAMELVQGITLKAVLEKRGTLAVRDVIRIAKQIFSALAHAHENDVIHRDIKPANLMLTQDGRLKITDFGIAQLPASDLTRAGTILGSPRYMSPEQLAGTKLDGRADIYSAGVVLYQALTGSVPFDGETTMNVVFNILHSQPVDPVSFNSEIPAWLAQLVLKCLAKKREDRFSCADDVLASIQSAGKSAVIGKESTEKAPTTSAQPKPMAREVPEPIDSELAADSPLLSWLQQTKVTLLWLLQKTAYLVNQLAQQVWPYCVLCFTKIKQWTPLLTEQLVSWKQSVQPHLQLGLNRVKTSFFALPRQAQIAISVLGLAVFGWMVWPNPNKDVSAATVVWSSPRPAVTAVSALVIMTPEPAAVTYSESELTSPAELELLPAELELPSSVPAPVVAYETVEPTVRREPVSTQRPPKPPRQARQPTQYIPPPTQQNQQTQRTQHTQTAPQEPAPKAESNNGLNQFGKDVNSAVTEMVDCFSGKGKCPTPAPNMRPPSRGG